LIYTLSILPSSSISRQNELAPNSPSAISSSAYAYKMNPFISTVISFASGYILPPELWIII